MKICLPFFGINAPRVSLRGCTLVGCLVLGKTVKLVFRVAMPCAFLPAMEVQAPCLHCGITGSVLAALTGVRQSLPVVSVHFPTAAGEGHLPRPDLPSASSSMKSTPTSCPCSYQLVFSRLNFKSSLHSLDPRALVGRVCL